MLDYLMTVKARKTLPDFTFDDNARGFDKSVWADTDAVINATTADGTPVIEGTFTATASGWTDTSNAQLASGHTDYTVSVTNIAGSKITRVWHNEWKSPTDANTYGSQINFGFSDTSLAGKTMVLTWKYNGYGKIYSTTVTTANQTEGRAFFVMDYPNDGYLPKAKGESVTFDFRVK